MYSETVEKVINAGLAKVKLSAKNGGLPYLLASMLAGVYVGLGILLITSIGGIMAQYGAILKVVMGISFGVALSLVIFAGSELFTGTNFVLAVSTAAKASTILQMIKIWIISYIGNLLGSMLVAALFVWGDLGQGSTADFILKLATIKMNEPIAALFFRGILCNLLVCLAVLCSIRMKEEGAKLFMIFWCLFAFITSGYEHSVANMTVFSVVLFVPHEASISLGGAAHNLLWVSLGNIVGGAGLGLFYYWIGRMQKSDLAK